jgi:transcriptional regulator with XRE-family HTH domain
MKNDRLISKRKEYGLTQKQIADLLSISQSMVSKAESGKRAFDDSIKVKLAQIYNVTVEWLFFEKLYDQKLYANSLSPEVESKAS